MDETGLIADKEAHYYDLADNSKALLIFGLISGIYT